jgi:hypothetical protein
MEVNDTFLYDLRRLSQDAGNLWDALRNLRTVAMSAKARWKNVANYEPQMKREVDTYKEKAKDTYHDFNVSYYTVSGKSIDIDIDAMVAKWLNNESK